MLWHLLYESSARAEEVLMLDVPDLDTANRCAVVTRKGGAREVVAWQTGTARLLPRMLAGRLSYRRAAELFENHTAGFDDGRYTLHQLRHSRLTHAAEDGASTPVLMKPVGAYLGTEPGQIRADLRRGVTPVSGRQRPRFAAAVI
ncbi:site-specific integrase [Nocardia sp. NPDC019395]|uniref:site-specific integrase n=1 Tax=Nocardia sp. NPDC019395 TaxID=3154686 RepID=UPI0033FCCCDC